MPDIITIKSDVPLTNAEKQARYLEAAPVHEQLEAIEDFLSHRPEKLEALLAKLRTVKQSFNNLK